MKLIYVALVALGSGMVGFIAGGGMGLLGGITAGGWTGGIVGTATGMCRTVDTATELELLTPAQAGNHWQSV